MPGPLTILLIDNSPLTSLRLVELLQNSGEVDHVYYAKDVRKGCMMFSAAKIDVMILATHLADDELVGLTNLCKVLGCLLILLSEYTHSSYRSWCKSIGITRLLDKTSEVNQVSSILKQMSY